MASARLRRQWEFARMVPRLIDKAHELGFHVTLGHAMRCTDCRVGNRNSLHKQKLAIDLHLFDADGRFLQDSESHQKLGEFWESIGGSWGGRFYPQDGNHYSLEFEGMR